MPFPGSVELPFSSTFLCEEPLSTFDRAAFRNDEPADPFPDLGGLADCMWAPCASPRILRCPSLLRFVTVWLERSPNLILSTSGGSEELERRRRRLDEAVEDSVDGSKAVRGLEAALLMFVGAEGTEFVL